MPARVQEIIKDYQDQIEQLQLQLQELSCTTTITASIRPILRRWRILSPRKPAVWSTTMVAELRRWLGDMALKPEILLCMLELCFERNIKNRAKSATLLQILSGTPLPVWTVWKYTSAALWCNNLAQRVQAFDRISLNSGLSPALIWGLRPGAVFIRNGVMIGAFPML